jgi:hypothetical protein
MRAMSSEVGVDMDSEIEIAIYMSIETDIQMSSDIIIGIVNHQLSNIQYDLNQSRLIIAFCRRFEFQNQNNNEKVKEDERREVE